MILYCNLVLQSTNVQFSFNDIVYIYVPNFQQQTRVKLEMLRSTFEK